AVGRLDQTPNALQQLGFAQCGSDVCFRGIRLGADWQAARALLPEAVQAENTLIVPINSETIGSIILVKDAVNEKVATINFRPADSSQPYGLSTISAGNLIVQYGTPCGLVLYYGNSGPVGVAFDYPTLRVETYGWTDGPIYQKTVRLQPDSL